MLRNPTHQKVKKIHYLPVLGADWNISLSSCRRSFF